MVVRLSLKILSLHPLALNENLVTNTGALCNSKSTSLALLIMVAIIIIMILIMLFLLRSYFVMYPFPGILEGMIILLSPHCIGYKWYAFFMSS